MLDSLILNSIPHKSNPFYFLDLKILNDNYNQFKDSLHSHYENTVIAYSYKTNYTPFICKHFNRLGAWAEVVSRMEYDIAELCAVDPKKILFNGPAKSREDIYYALSNGSVVHVDNLDEFELIQAWKEQNKDSSGRIALRLNFSLTKDHSSRFGISLGKELELLLKSIQLAENIELVGLHCHFTTKERSLQSYEKRLRKLIEVQKKYKLDIEYLDVGGAFFSSMPEELRNQFNVEVPQLKDYGELLGKIMQEEYGANGPTLIIEPGSSLVANTMFFVCQVTSVKQIGGVSNIICNGSKYNIRPTLHSMDMVYSVIRNENEGIRVSEAEISGYTCKEGDILVKSFSCEIARGDWLVFENIGAYSLVLKPPFIEPDFPVYSKVENEIIEIKRRQTVKDILQSYIY